MKERNYAVDFIRLFAILGVVIIHVSTAFIDRVDPFSLDFYIYDLINQISRFAVPLFFLISGFLLASKYHSIVSPISFYRRRLSKVILPYVIWSLIYFLLIFKNPLSKLPTPSFAENLYTGDTSYQLYFIPAIIVLYLLFPMIIYFKKYLLTKWFIFSLTLTIGIMLTYTYYNNINIPIDTPFRVAVYNLLPFISGIYVAIRIGNLNKYIKQNLTVLLAATITLGGIIFTEATYTFFKTNNSDYLRNQWRISVLLYGITLAPLLYYLYPKFLKSHEKRIYYFSTFALGVFFIHVAILKYVLKIIDKYNLYNPISFVICLLTVIGISFGISIILSKSSIINELLGLRS